MGYSFGQLFSLCTVTSHFTFSVFCSFIIALYLHIFYILNIILYYISAISNFIWRGKYPIHLVLGRDKCTPTLSFWKRRCLPSLFQGGKVSTPRFREGQMSRDKCPGGKCPTLRHTYTWSLNPSVPLCRIDMYSMFTVYRPRWPIR